jgi:hypothetical protein
MKSNGEKVALKKTDNYYYQVQAQLNIRERHYCYFVVWLNVITSHNTTVS